MGVGETERRKLQRSSGYSRTVRLEVHIQCCGLDRGLETEPFPFQASHREDAIRCRTIGTVCLVRSRVRVCSVWCLCSPFSVLSGRPLWRSA